MSIMIYNMLMLIQNKRAFLNYSISERIEAGVSLLGGEAKAVRNGHINLSNAYAKILNDEVYLVNADIPINGKRDYDPSRMRKLLLKRSEILQLAIRMKREKLTLVPTKVYTRGRLIKVELGLAKSKREFEKRESLKRSDVQRDLERSLRDKF